MLTLTKRKRFLKNIPNAAGSFAATGGQAALLASWQLLFRMKKKGVFYVWGK